ncbi:GNAT family N-acetyltransferase [Nocardioides conyzicola]|uniref:N-acetyltransferase domain-containing protein n=1 Tax=Nocardioides conyzicola TaxID=1651781 RepID=A0ABP8X2L8_9ACTN
MSVSTYVEEPAGCGAVTVRLATRDDHAAMRAVITAAYAQYEMAVGPEAFDRYLADLLDLDLHASHGPLVVAEVDGVVRGSAAFYPESAAQGLGWPAGWSGGRALAVHPDARGHGVARALVAACEELAHEYGAPVFAFHTLELMTDAIRLYERLGFVRAPAYDRDLLPHFGVTAGPPLRAIAYQRTFAATERRPSGLQLLRPDH